MSPRSNAPAHMPVFSAGDESGDWFEPLPGERMRVRIGSEDTGGQLTLLENIVGAGAAPRAQQMKTGVHRRALQ